MNKERWNIKEIKILKENHTLTSKELCKLLNRSKSSIDLKIRRLGLKRNNGNCPVKRIYIKNHPYSKNGEILEHRFVMEKWLNKNYPESPYLIKNGNKKYLNPKIIIHHKDKNRKNNRIENLQCVTKKEHQKIHLGGDKSHFYGKDITNSKNPNWKGGISKQINYFKNKYYEKKATKSPEEWKAIWREEKRKLKEKQR